MGTCIITSFHPKDDKKEFWNLRDESNAQHDLVVSMGGSHSEYGIGRLKVDDLKRYSDPELSALRRAIRAHLTQNILNPGSVLRR